MIVLKLVGGIGNQLFQYAVGKQIASFNNQPLYIDDSYYWYVRNREQVISKLDPKVKPLNLTNRIKFLLSKPVSLVENHPFEFESHILHTNSFNLLIHGFWQNAKYVTKGQKLIQKNLILPELPEEHQFKYLKNGRNIVSLHIRRSDYLKIPQLGTCKLKYYQKAIRYMTSHLSKPSFLIFSDDIFWAKQNLPQKNMMFVEEDNLSDLQQLQLMSNCRHHILANSTYSWWGAWLNNHPNSITIAPNPWFNHQVDKTKGMYLKKWILIDKE